MLFMIVRRISCLLMVSRWLVVRTRIMRIVLRLCIFGSHIHDSHHDLGWLLRWMLLVSRRLVLLLLLLLRLWWLLWYGMSRRLLLLWRSMLALTILGWDHHGILFRLGNTLIIWSQ